MINDVLVRRTIFDPLFRTTALGRKIASSIIVSYPKFFGQCGTCGKFKDLHPEVHECQECIVGEDAYEPGLELAYCDMCDEFRELHRGLCEPCIEVDAEDAMNYERIEEKYFN